MPAMRIFLFGVPRFERQDTPVHIPRRKAAALLAYLAATAQPHSRDSLATMFWPEHNQSKARANLRRELSRIKTALGEEAFKIEGDQVALQGKGWWLDVAAFQARLAAVQELLLKGSETPGEPGVSKLMEEFQESVSLYTGEFMAGFSLPDCPQFDEWQFFQRETLSRSLNNALHKLVAWKTVLGEYEEAIEYARRSLALDNLSESAHRQLMQLYAWSGQRGAAIRQYEQCVNLLKEEIGVEAEEETVMLFEVIKNRQLAPPDIEALRLETPWISDGQTPAQRALTNEGQLLEQIDATASIDLAVQATPFIGRESEQDQLFKLLVEEPHYRLISVVGPGGVGKTRLALEAAAAVQDAFPDGVHIIPLATLTSADQILSKIAEQLNFRFHAATEQKRQLFEFLRQKKLLLVMDNFEHVLTGSSLVVELLQNFQDVKVLITSRQRLNLSDEVVISLSGMDYPELGAGDFSSEDLSTYEALTLLVQSARRVQPDFNLAPEDLEPAARLCSLVEGMPLALILAASWLELLTMDEIVEEILQSLDFLESQVLDIPERQRSLRAVFNASWDLLEEHEQKVLERLTIFQDSFTRQAALAVTRTSLNSLLALLQKAWLQRNQDGRFQIHELQRQFAFEKLQTHPQAWEEARHELGTYYGDRLEKIDQVMRGPDQDKSFNEIAVDFMNIQSAWNCLVEHKEFKVLVLKLLPPIYRYCEARTKSDDLLKLVDVALQTLEGSSLEVGNLNYKNILLILQASFYSKGDSIRLHRYDIMIPPDHEENIHQVGSQIDTLEDLERLGLWGSLFAYLYGRFADSQKGQEYLRQLARKYRQENLPWELAVTLQLLGGLNLAVSLNANLKAPILNEAGGVLTEALGIFERLGDQREYSYTLLLLGGYHSYRQNWDEAIEIWIEAQAKFDLIGESITSIHWLLGDLLFKIGDHDAAFQYYQEIRERYLQRGHKRIAAYALSFESLQALRYSDIEHARKTREQALHLSREVQDEFGEAWSNWEMGEIHRVAGDYEAARLWFERAKVMFENVNEISGVIFYHRGLGDIVLAEGDYTQAYSQFEKSFEQAIKLNIVWGAAYSQSGMGRAAVALKNFDAADKHLSESLYSARIIEDTGLVLLVLYSCATLYAGRGEIGPALELCDLVVGHFATWREIKARATTLLKKLRTSPSSHFDINYMEDNQCDVWDMTNRLLEKDFKPA